MDRLAILALLNARPGKEAEVEAFLKSAQPLVVQETGTTAWYAIKTGPATFGIFDTFVDEEGRKAHVNGAIAKHSSQKPRNCLPPLHRSKWLKYWHQRHPTTS